MECGRLVKHRSSESALGDKSTSAAPLSARKETSVTHTAPKREEPGFPGSSHIFGVAHPAGVISHFSSASDTRYTVIRRDGDIFYAACELPPVSRWSTVGTSYFSSSC